MKFVNRFLNTVTEIMNQFFENDSNNGSSLKAS